MEQYLSQYGPVVMSSVFHLREALVFLTEKPEIIQQAVFVDVLERHRGKVRGDCRIYQDVKYLSTPNIRERSTSAVVDYRKIQQMSDDELRVAPVFCGVLYRETGDKSVVMAR